ncbi:hypothetical protein IW152_003591, partial [Coemansia sp. BCRC 34962]
MSAADLETRLLRAGRAERCSNSSRGKSRNGGPLDPWATGILEWIESRSLSMGDDNDRGRYSDDSELVDVEADYAAPPSESFMLFVAHHINEFIMCGGASELLRLEDCWLILPIAKNDTEADDDTMDFASFKRGMFPINSSVE